MKCRVYQCSYRTLVFIIYYIIMNTIELNWEKYVKLSEIPISTPSHKVDWLVYTLVRTYSAWVFCWFVQKKKWKECTILNARRLWYWDWAASLSQLSQEWVSKPESCKFPAEVPEIELTECIEYIPMTKKAVLSIANVPVWSQ